MTVLLLGSPLSGRWVGLAMAPSNAQSLAELFAAYGPRVYRRAHRLLGNAADAEEATQEIFIRVLEGISKFERQAELTTPRRCARAVTPRRQPLRRRHLTARGDGGNANIFVAGVSVGWGIDLDWASFFVRAHFLSSPTTGYGPRSVEMFGGGGGLERYIDFRYVSLGFGVLLEAEHTWQRVQTGRLPRQALAASATAFFFAERQLVAIRSAVGLGGGEKRDHLPWRPPLPPGKALGRPSRGT